MKAPFRRPLGDENDKIAFFLCCLGGIGLIYAIRIIGDITSENRGIGFLDWVAIIIAICVIAGYTLFIGITKKRSGISVDRASDNVYYLGLLFTLASLAYSLIKLSYFGMASEGIASAKQVLSLLPDFGLALFSTIAGIFGRIYLQQMRNDPVDVETEAREELGLAIGQLRETVGQVVSNLNALSAQTSLALSELNITVSKTLEESSNQNMKLVRGVAEDVESLSSKLKNQVTEVTQFTADSNAQFTEILGSMRTQFQSFGEIPKMLGDRFANLSVQLSSATEQIQQAAGQQNQLTTQLLNSVSALKTAFSEDKLSKISRVVEDAEKKFEAMNIKLFQNEGRLHNSLEVTNKQIELLNTTSQTITTYGDKIESSIKSVDEANNDYIEELSKAVETLRSKTEVS